MNVMQKEVPNSVSLKMLYNPQMKSSYNFVPGIMGMLLMLICAMMTSISIVREKERGTMEVLLVSPVRPLLIIVSKAMPYLALSFVVLLSILLMARYVLWVPISGSLWLIFMVSAIYIFLGLSLGLLISTIAETQMAALLMSAVMLLMPSTLLSGMMHFTVGFSIDASKILYIRHAEVAYNGSRNSTCCVRNRGTFRHDRSFSDCSTVEV